MSDSAEVDLSALGNCDSSERLVSMPTHRMASRSRGRRSSGVHFAEKPLDPEDPELLRRAAGGDEGAVRILYRSHVDRVHRHVARILGRHDSNVEDVVQKVFVAALDGASRFRGTSKVSTWLLGIASRRALDEARSRWRRDRWRRVTSVVGLGRAAGSPERRHDALTEAEQFLQLLNPDQRTVFVLKDVEGHTFKGDFRNHWRWYLHIACAAQDCAENPRPGDRRAEPCVTRKI